MNILFFGDIVGKVGRDAVHLSLPRLVRKYAIDFVIANGENASHGMGLTEQHYRALLADGVDCLTLGNHWRGKRQIEDYLPSVDHLVRPLNLLGLPPGNGSLSFDVNGIEIRVTNILGQAFIAEQTASPIEAMRQLLATSEPCVHFVDFHAESTSEKQIFAHCFDGLVTAVIGTHTHVQTNDARILAGGSAYLTDVGMCGDPNGIIGFEKRSVIGRIVEGRRQRFAIDEGAPRMINACVIAVNETTFLAERITPLCQIIGDSA